MPRKKQEFSPVDPYHVYARSNNKESFYLPMEDVWEIMSHALHFLSRAFAVQIHSFVLMPNHFHMIATFPQNNYDTAMNYFMRETSREIGRRSGRINHIYGCGARSSRIPNYVYFARAYRYIYRNPVKARLCSRVEEYPFSTLHGLLGQRHIMIAVVEDTLLFGGDIKENLSWLNTSNTAEQDESIRKALKKSVFEFGKIRSSREAVRFDDGCKTLDTPS